MTKPSQNEPRHDKTNKMSVHPAKTQISLGICPVWSESSPCAQRVAKDPRFLHADSEDSDQADLSLRWAHTHFVGFVMLQLIYCSWADLDLTHLHESYVAGLGFELATPGLKLGYKTDTQTDR